MDGRTSLEKSNNGEHKFVDYKILN